MRVVSNEVAHDVKQHMLNSSGPMFGPSTFISHGSCCDQVEFDACNCNKNIKKPKTIVWHSGSRGWDTNFRLIIILNLTWSPNSGISTAHIKPWATIRNVKFLATLVRTCSGMLWRQPRLTVSKRRIDVAPIELFPDSLRRPADELVTPANDIWYAGAVFVRCLDVDTGE